MRQLIASSLLIAPLLAATPAARADVVSATPTTIEIKQVVNIDAPIKQVWDTLRSPQKWWNKEHTYSGDSANLYLDSQATGCFCEKLPGKGSVEHGHIVYIEAPRVVRMASALGPLQAEAVQGTLTFKLDAEGDNATKLTMTYLVSGYMRAGGETMAPLVDRVLGEQTSGLKAAAEGAAPAAEGPSIKP